MDPIHCAYCFGEGRCYPDCSDIRERLHYIAGGGRTLEVVMQWGNRPVAVAVLRATA